MLGGFEQAANSVVRNQRYNWKTRKWITPKWVRIRQKYSAIVVSRDMRIKMEQSKTKNKSIFDSFLFTDNKKPGLQLRKQSCSPKVF